MAFCSSCVEGYASEERESVEECGEESKDYTRGKYVVEVGYYIIGVMKGNI